MDFVLIDMDNRTLKSDYSRKMSLISVNSLSLSLFTHSIALNL